jgi:hypothetical protein
LIHQQEVIQLPVVIHLSVPMQVGIHLPVPMQVGIHLPVLLQVVIQLPVPVQVVANYHQAKQEFLLHVQLYRDVLHYCRL